MANEKLSVDLIERYEQTDQKISQTLIEEKSTEEKELQHLKNENLKIENDTLIENRKTRKILIGGLSIVSSTWLIFTGVIVVLLCCGCCRLSDGVAIAFITTSLGTVLGLWAIGLRYFFSPQK
ncbi:MAG: hypothetical protein LBC74_03620 [Planctomycetaceae bacterium]|jgi:hypothetical protein|nr:hypothetical protein [Planctomycetaceae bacterium]